MHALRPFLRLAALALALAPPLALASPADERAEYERRRQALDLECAQRHLDLGLWCRDKGYVELARAQILLAVEVSGRRHQHANAVRSTMDQYGERFWKKRVEVNASRRKSFDKKLAKVLEENAEERFELAVWAADNGLADEALATFSALLDPSAPLELDRKGNVVTSAGTIPESASAAILAGAVRVNGRPHLRDAVLSLLPDVEEIHEAASPLLRVRALGSLEQAQAYHALGAALVPALERELARPFARRPDLLLFDARAAYEAYLVEADRQSYRSVSGFADPWRFTTVACLEGLPDEQARGLVLHELAHLADADAFPQAMPPWFREGFAETFGGPGTFAWDGERLTVGGTLDGARLEALRAPGGRWAVADFVRIDPLSLWGSDRDAAQRYYAQAWALYRLLSREAALALRARWDGWLEDCRAAQPASLASPGPAASPAQLFEQRFGEVYPELDRALEAWLEDR